jgi:hypothetical protein
MRDESKPLDAMGAVTVLVSWLGLLLIHPDAVVLVFFGLAVGCALLRGRVAITRTQWLVACLLGLVIAMAFFKPESKRAVASGLIYANLYPVALSLGLATLPALLRRHTRREYWTTMSVSGLFFLVCGMTLDPLTREFAVISALWMIGFCCSSRRLLTGTAPGAGAWLSLVPSLFLLGVTAAAFAFSEQQVNLLLRLLSSAGDVSLAFPAQSHLNTLMSSETNPAVVVRCFSRRPNTYLAARVYTHYANGLWSEFGPSSTVSGVGAEGGYRYALTEAAVAPSQAPALERFEVHASPIVLFAPRDAAWLEVNQPQLARLSGHLLEQRGGGNDLLAYHVARLPGQDLAPAESPEYLQSCLSLPPDLNPVVSNRARQVMGQGTPWQKGLRCVEWFHSQFTYGFGFDFARQKDPIGEFLLERPPAHCEIFAATMTLMMRTQGVPARYLNGFVCVERSFGGDYYVVRVRDAHAWVEIWDGKAWRTLDPTPPSAIAPPKSWMGWFDTLREAFNYYTRRLRSLDWREWLAMIWDWRRALGGVLVLLALWKMRKMSWFLRVQPAPRLAVDEHGWIRRLSAALEGRKLGRASWETVLHWAGRVRDHELVEVADWLRDYSLYRYSGGSQSPEALRRRLEELLKSLQSPPS